MARIVIIEDDGALRNDVADKLGEWGHEVHQAHDGVTGLEIIGAVRPELVLCDICMPSGSGFDLVKHVREASFGSAHLAIIFISALAEPKALLYGAHCGADDYIVKPIDYGALNAKIAHHLQKGNGMIARFAKFVIGKPDSCYVDVVERRVTPNLPRSFGRRKTDRLEDAN